MSQSTTWDALQVARDARLWGATAWCEQILAEVAPDFAYVKRTHRRVVMRFWFEQRAAWRDRMRSIDWLSWANTLKANSFDATLMLKELYSENRITELAFKSNPMLSFLRRDGSGNFVNITNYASSGPGDSDA